MSQRTKSQSKSTARTRSQPTSPPTPAVQMPIVEDEINGRAVVVQQMAYSQARYLQGLGSDLERTDYLLSFVKCVDGHEDWQDRLTTGQVVSMVEQLSDFFQR